MPTSKCQGKGNTTPDHVIHVNLRRLGRCGYSEKTFIMTKSLEKIQMNPDPIYITVFVNLLISESATQTELFEKINELLEISLPRDTIKSLLAAVSTKKNGKFHSKNKKKWQKL